MVRLYKPDMTALQLKTLLTLYTNPLETDVNIGKMVFADSSNIQYTLAKMGYTEPRLQTFCALGYINLPDVMPRTAQRMVNSILLAMQHMPCGTMQQFALVTGYTYHSTVMSVRKTYNYFDMPLHPNRLHRTRLGFYAHMGWFDTERLARDAKLQYDAIQEMSHARTI